MRMGWRRAQRGRAYIYIILASSPESPLPPLPKKTGSINIPCLYTPLNNCQYNTTYHHNFDKATAQCTRPPAKKCHQPAQLPIGAIASTKWVRAPSWWYPARLTPTSSSTFGDSGDTEAVVLFTPCQRLISWLRLHGLVEWRREG
jgi:hypothetical protein